MKKSQMKHTGSLGCTIGLMRTSGGYLFFKNRDLPKSLLHNRITAYQSTSLLHALKGINYDNQTSEGISIGINKYRVCVANTHVVTNDGITYDVLCERLLNQTRGKKNVPLIVQNFMMTQATQGGRILVAGVDWAYLIEVYQKSFQIQEIPGNTVLTNTFALIPMPQGQPLERQDSSQNRLSEAIKMIKQVSTLGHLKSMLRSHIPCRGELSICNHRDDGGGTESSHIIEIKKNYVGWSSLLGFPCENDYTVMRLFD